MQAYSPFKFLFGVLFFLAGCAGMGVVATSDPAAKLQDARHLFDQADRPLIAERLIREAIDIYQDKNDQIGLAEAYRHYGFFFRSRAVGRWSTFYREKGFLDKSAQFERRYPKSIEYFKKARTIFAEYKRFDVVANLDLNIGFTHELSGDRRAACLAFDRSLESNREDLRLNPDAKVSLPRGAASFEEYLKSQHERAGCDSKEPAQEAGKASIETFGQIPAVAEGTASVTLRADWIARVSQFPQPQRHWVGLLQSPDGVTTRQIGQLRNKSLLRGEDSVSSVAATLQAGTPLKLALSSSHHLGQFESKCYVPFSISLEPNRRYMIDFVIMRSKNREQVSCNPKFFVLDENGAKEEITVRKTW